MCLITLTEEDSRRPQDGDEDWEILRTVGSEHDEKMKQLLIISHVVEEVFRSLTSVEDQYYDVRILVVQEK